MKVTYKIKKTIGDWVRLESGACKSPRSAILQDLVEAESLYSPGTEKTNSNPCSSHNFRRYNLDTVFACIQGFSYPTVDSTKAEENFTLFCRNLADVIKLNSPIRNSKRSNFPKWFTAELRRLVVEKKTVHRRFKETGNLSLYDSFRKLRNRCRQLAGECYRDYTNYVESAIPNNIKIFLAHINNLKKANITSNLVYNDVEVDEPSGQSELFADYFSSVYTNISLPSSDFDFRTSVNLHSLVLTAQQVESKLKALDPYKGMGPEPLPPAVIKPIAIQSVLAKVFESLVVDKLVFDLKHVIAEEQHGFRRCRSTSNNLLVLRNYVTSAFFRRRQVDCILLNFSKAFDRVNHNLLISKLRGYGITGSLLEWLSSCLMFADDVKIFVEVNSPEDCQRLQDTLDHIGAWCQRNGMDLNADKSAVLTYSRLDSLTVFNYTLFGSSLNKVCSFKDLGVVMSNDLRHIDTLEGVQIRFLRLIGLRLGYQFLETPVDCLRISLGLPHLATRRRMADILILHKMVNGALDCPRLLSLLEFRIPTSTRSGDIFFKRALPSLYSYHSCIPRLMREGNEVSGGVEFFGSSYQSFSSRLGKLL
ncbi:uncharacterized protein LOC124370398 [Homalodisca vitripennis]|uniref:uncharacterized protein LOC124370398 n=1 Tax=Homalodisca vitripennis TaxID=197043 RepID=UPI001EEA4DB0|nr:uncharacterized protein LOC124370398 [Homalodisca vitripennis]